MHGPLLWRKVKKPHDELELNIGAACQLRTVSRKLWYSVNQILAREHTFVLNCSRQAAISRSVRCLTDTTACVDTKNMVSTVKRLLIKHIPDIVTPPVYHALDPDILVNDLMVELDTLLNSMASIQEFQIEFPTGFLTKTSFYSHGPAEIHITEYNIDALSRVIAFMNRHFQKPNFNLLQDLRLFLPCTYNFGQLNIPDKVLGSLKHLYLGVGDITGPGCSRIHLARSDEVSDRDFEDEVRLSNLQQQYPNPEHSSCIWDIIRRCQNLESLGLTGVQVLDLDELNWNPSISGLKNLSLARVKCQIVTLKQFLNSRLNSDRPPRISRVSFQEVQLKDGEWKDIFDFLRNDCPDIHYLNPTNIGYAPMHPLRDWAFRPWEDSSDVWTKSAADRVSLVELVQLLLGRSGGRLNYPHDGMELHCIRDEIAII
jgi:hypothetical protein